MKGRGDAPQRGLPGGGRVGPVAVERPAVERWRGLGGERGGEEDLGPVLRGGRDGWRQGRAVEGRRDAPLGVLGVLDVAADEAPDAVAVDLVAGEERQSPVRKEQGRRDAAQAERVERRRDVDAQVVAMREEL